MPLSNYLAELWGILLVLVPLALLINPKYLKRIFNEADNELSLFVCGIVNLTIGLAMVLSHNIWVKNWQVIVTIIGWLALIRGLAFLFLPEYARKIIKKMEAFEWLSICLVVLIFIGLVVAYFGFTA